LPSSKKKSTIKSENKSGAAQSKEHSLPYFTCAFKQEHTMSDDYYTATEATRILGVSVSRFYHLVQQGKIARIVLLGDARHFVYHKEDIDRLAEALAQVQAEPETESEQLVLKAFEHAEMAYSRATGITLSLTLALEALPAHSPQAATIKALIEQAGEVSKMLQTLQLDVAGLADQE
jgi:hypothetical protein